MSKDKKDKDNTWTKEKIYELISLYKENSCLWDTYTESYKDREERAAAIDRICKTLNVGKGQFLTKIHNLRNQFNFEVKKIQKKHAAGIDIDERNTKWEYYEPLKFLKKVIVSRSSLINIQDFEMQALDDEAQSIEEDKKDQITLIKPKKKTVDINESTKIDKKASHPDNSTLDCNITLKRPKIESQGEIDEYEIFGKFVASELRSLCSDISRKKLKRRILQSIFEVGNEDDGININIKLT